MKMRKTLFFDFCDFVAGCCRGVLSGNDSRLAQRLRSRRWGRDVFIDTAVLIQNRANITLEPGSALYHGCHILNASGAVSIGAHSHLGAYCHVNALQGRLAIGEHVAIGPGTGIFTYSNHYEKGKRVTDVHLTGDITIGNNVFIGANCSILPGSHIGDNVIVGAGSVVKGVLESNAIYAGAPCRLLCSPWH